MIDTGSIRMLTETIDSVKFASSGMYDTVESEVHFLFVCPVFQFTRTIL